MAFKKYYDGWIHEWVYDRGLDNEIERIYSMNLDQLNEYQESYRTEVVLDSDYAHSHECRVIGKTILKATDMALKRGESLTPKITLMGVLTAVMEGVYMSNLMDKLDRR